jgi:hypothetical protein
VLLIAAANFLGPQPLAGTRATLEAVLPLMSIPRFAYWRQTCSLPRKSLAANPLDHETDRLEQSKCDMHDLGLALRAPLEPQHWGVFWEDLGDQRLDSGGAGNARRLRARLEMIGGISTPYSSPPRKRPLARE